MEHTQAINDLVVEVSNLAVQLEDMKHLMKCDFTGWNQAEAIGMLALELKRYNDAQGYKA